MLTLASKLQGKKETLICFSQYLNFVVSKRGGGLHLAEEASETEQRRWLY